MLCLGWWGPYGGCEGPCYSGGEKTRKLTDLYLRPVKRTLGGPGSENQTKPRLLLRDTLIFLAAARDARNARNAEKKARRALVEFKRGFYNRCRMSKPLVALKVEQSRSSRFVSFDEK